MELLTLSVNVNHPELHWGYELRVSQNIFGFETPFILNNDFDLVSGDILISAIAFNFWLKMQKCDYF